MKRTLEEDVEASLENIADGGGTVAEHAALLARDHGLSFNEAVEILNKAIAADPYFREGGAMIYPDDDMNYDGGRRK